MTDPYFGLDILTWLYILGAICSIIAIPLAIWIYLKTKTKNDKIVSSETAIPFNEFNPERNKVAKSTYKKRFTNIPSGKHAAYGISLIAGNHVSVVFKEVNHAPLNFFIVDEENYLRYFNEESRWDTLYNKRNIISKKVEIDIPHTAKWYFVFEVYGKQYPRTVDLTLDVL